MLIAERSYPDLLFAAGLRVLSARINRAGFYKAKRVLPPIFGVERSLAPRANADAAAGHAVHILLRQAPECFCSFENCIEILDREVKGFRRGMRFASR